jgi:hypothetical protein
LTRGLTAVVEGGFALLWFAWGGADAPGWLDLPLALGSAAAALVVVAGIVVTVRHRGEPGPMRDARVRRRYNATVATEFVLVGAGAAILGAAGLAEWIAVWVGAVVGLHFLPLARIFGGPVLTVLAVLVTAAAVAALVAGLASSAAPSTVAGAAIGACLVGAAVVTLSRA